MGTEADFMRRCMKRATELGARLYRNNVGVLPDKRGIPVRYGLATGSSDLIGFVPVTVTPDMVGQTLAVFVSVETKAGRGKATKEQDQWLAMVAKHGGRAGIARTDDDLDQIIGVDHDLAPPR
jgi:hypothetical protein